MGLDFLTKKPYSPPSWASHLNPIPSHFISLAHLPTPIHKWNLPNLPNNTQVWLKRDDLSGMQLSGSKVRRLEFLLADAAAQAADCIITIGAIQSNHCRATAVAARYLNLDSYIILFTSKDFVDQDPGLTGNLLVGRLVGAHVELISETEYANIGSVALTNHLKEKLISEGRRPYVIPVGGANSFGTWGDIESIREIEQQLQSGNNGDLKFDDIVVACGSGGTVAGVSLGSWMSSLKAKVHAFSICEDPDCCYDFVQALIDGLEAHGVASRDIVTIQNAKGMGYAISTREEIKFIEDIAAATGVVLDPVYSGKAAYGLLKNMSENPKKWEGRKILFIHTGGLLGLYGKTEQIEAKGMGYAISTREEIKFLKDIAAATGVVLDPVYSGKAAYGLLKNMSENPKKLEGRKILFIHTGGLLGLYGKAEQMEVGNWRRMDIPKSVWPEDGIVKML